MADSVFQGGVELTLDGKGRVTVPALHRAVLAGLDTQDLTLTKHPNRCLLVFPRAAWETFRAKLLNLTMDAEDWRRVFLGSAINVTPDGASRVLIPPELRSWAGLDRGVMMVGMGARMELWDKARHDAREAATLSAPMPDALRNLVL